jgi:hypothetical protein
MPIRLSLGWLFYRLACWIAPSFEQDRAMVEKLALARRSTAGGFDYYKLFEQ